MTSGPWHKRYHSDALTGYRGLTLEQRGAYTTILDLLYDSGEDSLSASERWMAGQLDVSVRKWRAIRDELVDLGKLSLLPDGRITNARYLREKAKAEAVSAKRAEAGAKGGSTPKKQVELPLAGNSSTPENELKTSGDSAFSTPENDLSGKDNSGEPEAKTAENGQSGQASASDLPPIRARVPDTRYQKLDKKEDNTTNVDSTPPRGDDDVDDDPVLSKGDLMRTAARIARAGATNLNPAWPTPFARELDLVKGWLDEGIDVEGTILPTVERMLERSNETSIGSLKFYDGAIRKAHALAERKAGKGTTKPVEPKPPIPVSDDADPRLAKVREQLKTTANGTYATWLAPEHTAFTIRGDILLLRTRSRFYSDYIDANLRPSLERVAGAVDCTVVRVEPI